MSTTQELIERLHTGCECDVDAEPQPGGSWTGRIIRCDRCEAADRLASLSAELEALKAKLAGVDEKALEVAWRQYATIQAREAGDHRTFSEEQWTRVRQGNPSAYSRLRAAIAAYLAALGGGG